MNSFKTEVVNSPGQIFYFELVMAEWWELWAKLSQASPEKLESVETGQAMWQSAQHCIVLMYFEFTLQFCDQFGVNEAIFGVDWELTAIGSIVVSE